MTHTRCPGCPDGTKGPGKYLCHGCWTGLTMAARRALKRRDRQAIDRLQELYRQLGANVPLTKITITP
ncbi:hypothetical protein ACIQAC_01415 [Streptomyces sp. NPDC088387]|uniref:hypothetical protein n=1 Tax=Streptomyces sp. NPDC088387 TaxID=3365859 RepID=UPI0038291386